MGIIKKAKKIKILVNKDYAIGAGSVIDFADKINIEAKKENLTLISNKVVQIKGKEGIKLAKYSPPDLVIEKSEYKLESTYAHDQLCSLADDLAEMTFMFFMMEIFGYEIEISALSRLYRNLSDRKIKSPEIIVSKVFVGGEGRIAGYSNKRKIIIVHEKFIEEAVNDNDKKAELLAVLVEEYGHHIDNLLRTELATNGIKDEDVIDEGAKFAYQLFKFDIFEESSLTYGTTELPSYSGNLTIDFSILHNDITSYVNENQQYDETTGANTSNYGAGRNRKKNKNAAYAHGDVEFEALTKQKLFSEAQVRNIYYGNWLRDFSQVIVGISVRSTNFGIELQKNKVVKEAMPMKLSHEGWISLMEILAIKEFIYDPLKDAGTIPEDNYETLKKKFTDSFGALTKDVLGIYRPEEHIDNPQGLENESGIKDDKGKIISFKYDNGTEKTLYAGDNKASWGIDKTRNMSNFFWIDYPSRPSSVTYMKEQIRLACNNGQNAKGFRHLGAALHVLEDFFAHTNFVEICLIRFKADVYPWIQDYKGKNHTELPVVSGTFLTDDTFASVAPKIADLLFDPEIKDYKRRKPKQRPLGEMFILKTLEDFANGQKSDTAKKSSSYLGVEFSTWLSWFKNYLTFQDYLATKYQAADKKKWMSKDFFEKLGANAAESLQKSMKYTGQVMAFFPKLVINIILGSFDEVIPEAQSHLKKNYGNCPSHSQLAKDSYSHPLNKLSAELAKHAVNDVGGKFKAGWKAEELAKYVAETYFVHPSSGKARWSDDFIIDWKNDPNNKNALVRLKSATIYEHVHHEAQEISKESVKKIKEIMEYFNKLSK